MEEAEIETDTLVTPTQICCRFELIFFADFFTLQKSQKWSIQLCNTVWIIFIFLFFYFMGFVPTIELNKT